MDWNPERILVYRRNPDALAMKRAAPDQSRQQRVGIWDLDASAGSLPHVLDAVEDVQTYFSFYSVEAPFQTGLTTPGDHVAAEWKQRTGESMSRSAAAVNISARPIFAAAQPVLDTLPIDWLVIVVKSMIADSSDLSDSWYNLFSTTQEKIVLVSTFDMRAFAAKAGRPFEAAIVGTALSMLLQQMVPDLTPTPGTIFDFCENRSDIVKLIRAPVIDAANRQRIPEDLRAATEQILGVLTTYTGSVTPAQFLRQRKMFADVKKMTLAPKVAPMTSFDAVLKTLSSSLLRTAPKKHAVAKKRAGAKKRSRKVAKRGK